MSRLPTTTAGEAPAGLAHMRRAPTHPGVILTEWLQELGVSAAEAARRIGVSRAQLNHVQTGHRQMPMTMCVKVAALLGTSAEFWATLQMRHDLWHAMHEKTTARELRAIVPLVTTGPATIQAR